MPIAKPTPVATSSPAYVSEPTITKPEYRNAVVDTQYVPMSGLLTHLPGMKLSTTYYHQVIGRDEEPSPFDPTQQAPYQQYRKIVDFEILLQGSISTDIDTQTQTTRVSGSAILYPGLIPIDGDAFIMDIGDGRASQCTVTNVRRLSLMRDSAFEFNFVISRYVDETIQQLLDSRVVVTNYFRKDFLAFGQNPFLIEEDYNSLLSLDKSINNLSDYWCRTYWNPAFKTFTVPSQWSSAYDPWFVRFILELLPIHDDNNYRFINVLNVDDYNLNNTKSVWDMLLKRDTFLMNSIFKDAALISAKNFNNRPLLNAGIYYSGIADMVGPKTIDFGYGNNEHNYSASYGWRISINCNHVDNLTDSGLGFKSDITVNDGTPGLSLPVLFKENSYVFTKAFYAGDEEQMSEFERLVWKGINNEAINASELMAFYNSINKWSKLDQFYLIPTLILLMKYAKRSM